MDCKELIDRYLAGPDELRKAVAGMTAAEMDSRPIPGKWSTRQVLCHLADTESLYAERMKRVLAENEPTFFAADPDLFAAHLHCDRRDMAEELELIDVTRRQMGRILGALGPTDFARRGIHSADGSLSLQTLLERVTGHLPHHIRTIEEKRAAMR